MEEEYIIPIDIPNYDTSTITGIPNYTQIPYPNYDGSNYLEFLAIIRQLLINETSGETSNFMRASGNQIIVGSKQFSNIIVVPNIDAQGNIIDDGTLTVHQESYLNGGININNKIIIDSSGNMYVNNTLIPNSILQNLQYYDMSGSLLSRFTNNETNITNNTNSINTINTNLPFKADKTYVDTSIANLIGSSPTLLNTLKEIDDAINNDPNFSTSITNLISTKQDILTNQTNLLGSSLNGISLSNFNKIVYVDVSGSILTRFTNDESNITNNTNAINTINTNITSIQSKQTTDETNITNNTNSINSINSTLTTIQTNQTTDETNITSNTNSISTINTNITNLQNNKQNTLSNASYLDFTSSGQTQINTINTSLTSKQNTITTSTNLSINNLTAAGTISLPNNSLTTSMISGYSSGVSLSTSNTWTAAQTFTTQTNLSQIGENFTSVSGSTSPFTFNFQNGSIQYIPSDYATSLASNFNIKITNLPLQSLGSKTYTFSIIYKNSNKVYASNLILQDTGSNYLCGSAVATYISPNWSGGSVPTLTASTIIIQTFTLLYILNSSGSLTYTNILSSVNSFV